MNKNVFLILADATTGEVLSRQRHPKLKVMTPEQTMKAVTKHFPDHEIYSPLERAPAGSRLVVAYLSQSADGIGRNGRNWDLYAIGAALTSGMAKEPTTATWCCKGNDDNTHADECKYSDKNYRSVSAVPENPPNDVK